MHLPYPESLTRPTTRILSLAALIFTLNAAPSLTSMTEASDAGLFSEISMSDVVASSSKTTSTSDSSSKTLLGTSGLSKLLTKAELKHQKQDNFIRVQPSDVLPPSTTTGPFSFQLTVDPEAKRVKISLPIQKTDSKAKIDGATLMKLLVTVSKQNGIALSASSSTLSLQGSISNQTVEVNDIKEQCIRLAGLAAEANTILTPVNVATNTATKTTTAPTAKPTTAASRTAPPKPVAKANTPPTPNIAGTWSAKIGNDNAWAIAFGGDGKYTMVHTKNQKNSISRGAFSINNQTLTLAEAGAQSLAGKIVMSSQKAFSWKIAKPDGSLALQLNFAKK